MTPSVRLASFNLFSGRRPFGQGGPVPVDPDDLRAAVRELDVDVLAIQEVDVDQPRSAWADQTALVAASMGARPATHASGAVGARFVRTVRGTPGEPDVWPDDGPAPGYGIGLVSPLPVAEWHELRISPAPGRFPLPIPSRPPRLLWLPDEPRAAVAVVLAEPRLTIACTHLTFVPGVNVRQLRQVRRWLLGLPGPRILLGDLNLPGSLPARLTGWTSLVSAPTYPSTGPRVQLDHALSPDLPPTAVTSADAVRLPISDHLALRLTIFPRTTLPR